jgi:hypothetical protein
MWIDPNDANRIVVGNDGGVAITYDKGGNYNFLNTLPLGQAYEVSFDMAVPYNVCAGYQDNGTWCGPSRRSRGTITNLGTYSGAAFDRAYMQSQVDLHQWLLTAMDTSLIPSTSGSARTLLETQRASVAAHLDQARRILNTL